MSDDKPKQGQQPESLRSLEAAAKHGSKKPADQGLRAKGDTAPQPAPLEQEQQAAADVLKAGTEHDPKRMDEAARKAPRR
jgi:hypothetical protein